MVLGRIYTSKTLKGLTRISRASLDSQQSVPDLKKTGSE